MRGEQANFTVPPSVTTNDEGSIRMFGPVCVCVCVCVCVTMCVYVCV